jgi:peroxiredoxin
MKTGKSIVLVSALLTVFLAAEVYAAGMPMAPDFTLQDMNGKNVSLKDFKGKNVLLIFTTTWCPYCKREVPELNEMNSKYKGKLEILAIDMNESKTKVESFIKKYQVTYTTLLDREATVARNYGIRGVPTKVLVGPDGKLFCYPCYDLANQVEELLKKPAAPSNNKENTKPSVK